MKKIRGILLLLVLSTIARAQISAVDSLTQLLVHAKDDTNTVQLLARIGLEYYYNKPDSTYYYAHKGILIARDLHYKKGEADCTLLVGEAFSQMGNYPKALDFLLFSLKLSEDIKYRDGIEKSFYLLETLYYDEKDLPKAIEYNVKALEMERMKKDEKLEINLIENLGIDYAEMNRLDSAIYYLGRANEAYIKMNNKENIALSQINLGNAYFKMKRDKLALDYYRRAMPYITLNRINEALCETALYMAGIFQRMDRGDSALFYGMKSLNLARSHFFTSRQIDASNFVSSFYESKRLPDSALKYIKLAVTLKDSIFNQEKLRAIQNLTFDENSRQREIVEQNKISDERTIRNTQLTAIAVFIPIFFLLIIFLGRVQVKPRVVEFLAIVNLLLFFEFITDLVFPYISDWTNDRPVWEMLILVAIAALIEPLNYRIERWVKLHLVKKRVVL